MLSDNKNADNSRPDSELNSPEVKINAGRRIASYGLGRLIDRPNIGDGRRNRRHRRGLDIDIPTGGVPGLRKPTGSRLDIDGDGWADEGTTKPVWVGLPKIELPKKPKIHKNQDYKQPGYKTRLSSGSGSKKLKIVNDDDERIKNFAQYFFEGTFNNVNKSDVEKENIQLSTDLRDLTRSERRKRHYLNPFRFVEFEQSNGEKKLYMLATDSNADGVVAYDVEKLIAIGEKSRAFSGDVDEKVFSTFHFSDVSEFKNRTRDAIAGILYASKPIGEPKDKKNWEIYSIEVKNRHQRRGLGSALLKMHRDTWPELGLDHSESLTDDGAGFANATPVERLSSGVKKPSWPRSPTLGAFIDGADDVFGDTKTWEEFKDIYNNREMVFLDYETTGLVFDEFRKPSSNGNPVQIGLVKMKNGKVIDRINLFMNPEEPLGEWSLNNLKDSDGNPLTDKWLSGQMSIGEAHKQVIEFIGDDAIIGVQNATFDKAVLEDALDATGSDWRPFGYLDTKEISDMVLPKWTPETQDGPYRISNGEKVPSNGLADITKYLGVELGDKHHDASADAEAAGLVMSAIIDGAIKNGWSRNVLDRNKRNEKMKANRDAFDAKISQFKIDKENYLKNLPSEEKLSSGKTTRTRPIIKMSSTEAETINAHRNRKYKYGDKSVFGNGKEMRRDTNNWLEGLTPEQMAELLIPSSEDEHFSMWLDDFAPNARNIPEIKEAFAKYWKEHMENNPWDKPDYSPEAIQSMRNSLIASLESNPYMRWAFETHGAPMFSLWSPEGIDSWESRPTITELLDKITKSRGYKERAYTKGRLSPFVDMVLFHPRAVVDMVDARGEKIPMSLGENHVVTPGDQHIDGSLSATFLHEWGHWLHFRAIRDYENQTRAANRSYYGSGNKNDPGYSLGLEIAQQYNSSSTNKQLIKLHEDGIDIESDPNAPRTITAYAHISPAEMIAEGIVAVLHPNRGNANSALNAKLKKDVEILLGGDGETIKPWEMQPSKEIAITNKKISSMKKSERNARLSSGKIDALGRENRRLNTSKSPAFREKATQGPIRGKYKKGYSPKHRTLEREMRTDWWNLQNSIEAEFFYVDQFDKKQYLYTYGRGNADAARWIMTKKIADSMNFEPEEVFEMFNDSHYAYDGSESFYVNIENMPPLSELVTDKTLKTKHSELAEKFIDVFPKELSDFYGLKPKQLLTSEKRRIRASDHYVKFDADSPEGRQMLKMLIINEMFQDWNISTKRQIPTMMSKAAESLFGTKNDTQPKILNLNRKEEFVRDLISSVYDLTQSYFETKGITHINLFRGMQLNKENKKEILNLSFELPEDNNMFISVVDSNPLSSWSSNFDDARVFAGYPDMEGVTLKQIVPVRDIVGAYLFGFGTRGENEFIVLGKKRPTLVQSNNNSWTTQAFDLFESADDDLFYAHSKSLANKFKSSETTSEQLVSQISNSFVDEQNESLSRLSSGKRERVIRAIRNAFGKNLVRKQFDVEPDSETDKPKEEKIISRISGPDGIQKDIDGQIEVVPLSVEVMNDAVELSNAGPGFNVPSDSVDARTDESPGALRWTPDTSANAKRVVAHLLADIVDEDIETLGSMIFSKEAILGLFDPETAKKVKALLELDDSDVNATDDFFGTDKFVSAAKEIDDDKFYSMLAFELEFSIGPSWEKYISMPTEQSERRRWVSELALLGDLIRVSSSPRPDEPEDNFKFRINPKTGQLLVKHQELIALAAEQNHITKAKILEGLSKRLREGTNANIREILFELYPEISNALNELQKIREYVGQNSFGFIAESKETQTQIMVERMIDDMLRPIFIESSDYSFRRKKIVQLLKSVGGLTDDDLKLIGYPGDGLDEVAYRRFDRHMDAVLNQIAPKGFGEIRVVTSIDDFSNDTYKKLHPFIKNTRAHIDLSQVDKLEPKLEDVEKIMNQTDGFGLRDAQNLKASQDDTVRTRRRNLKTEILDRLFNSGESKAQHRRVRAVEILDTFGNRNFVFENADLPTNVTPEALIPTPQSVAVVGPQMTIVGTHIINLPPSGEGDLEGSAALDMFLTEQRLKQKVTSIAEKLQLGTALHEKQTEMLDYENLEYSTSPAIQAGVTVGPNDNVEVDFPQEDGSTITVVPKQLDVRTPEGQFALKQRIMKEIVRSWAESSNKTITSMLVQQVAGEMFGVEEQAKIKDVLGAGGAGTLYQILQEMGDKGEQFNLSPQQKRALQAILKGMHESTQEYFRSKGITHITIYRGVKLPKDAVSKDVIDGEIVDQMIMSRPLSSWATTAREAQNFASPGKDNIGVVMAAVVPVEDVLSIPLTGFGCLSEDEVVLIGHPREVKMVNSAEMLRRRFNPLTESESPDAYDVVPNLSEYETTKRINEITRRLETTNTTGDSVEMREEQLLLQRYQEFLDYAEMKLGPEYESILEKNDSESRKIRHNLLREFDKSVQRKTGTKETLLFGFLRMSGDHELRQAIKQDIIDPLRAEEATETSFEERLSSGISINRKNNNKPDIVLEQIGQTRRVELRNNRNVERFRNKDKTNSIIDDYFMFDSIDGLSVNVFSGQQLQNYINNNSKRFPSSDQLRRLVNNEKPIAKMSIRGLKNNGELDIDISVNEEHNIPGLAETMADFHNRHNRNLSSLASDVRARDRLSSGGSPVEVSEDADMAEEVFSASGGERITQKYFYSKPKPIHIQQIKEASQRIVDSGLKVKQFIWTGPDGKKHTSPLIQISGRAVVVVDVNGINIPFYMSSGRGGKQNVPSGKWYPFFGVDNRGWFNKTSEEDINNFYGIPEFKSIAQILNSAVSRDDLPERDKKNRRDFGWNLGTVTKKRMWQGENIDAEFVKPEIDKVMHRDANPNIGEDKTVRFYGFFQYIKKTLDKVKNGRKTDKAGYRTKPKRRFVVDFDESGLDSQNAMTRDVDIISIEPNGEKLVFSIASSKKNRDEFGLPANREVSVYIRNSDGVIIGMMHARNARPQEGDEGSLIISDITVDEKYQRRRLATQMMEFGTKYSVDGEKISHSRALSPLGRLFADGTPQERLSSGRRDSQDAKRREIGRLLAQKDGSLLSSSMISIANDYANYRYNMSDEMAEALLRRFRNLPDYDPNDIERRLSSGGSKLRKVGKYKAFRHGPGEWETQDNYGFRQGTPPTRLWDVYDLRNDPEMTDPIFETQHGKLEAAIDEFRKDFPERDIGEKPIGGYKENNGQTDSERLSSGRRIERRNNRSSGMERTTSEKISRGPNISAMVGSGEGVNGTPEIVDVGRLERRYGKTSGGHRRYFKRTHGIRLNAKAPRDSGDRRAYYGALQALDELLSSTNTNDIAKMGIVFRIRNSRKSSAFELDPSSDAIGMFTVPVRKRGKKTIEVFPNRAHLSAFNLLEALRNKGKGIVQSSKYSRISDLTTVNVLAGLLTEAGIEDVEEIAQRIGYAAMVHEFGHLLDNLARNQNIDLPNQERIKNMIKEEGKEATLKMLRKLAYFSGDAESKNQSWTTSNAVSTYGATNIQEKMAEAFTAWWLFSRTTTPIKAIPRGEGGYQNGLPTDISIIARPIVSRLIEALDSSIKQLDIASEIHDEETDEDNEIHNDIDHMTSTTSGLPPLVELYGILPYIDMQKQQEFLL